MRTLLNSLHLHCDFSLQRCVLCFQKQSIILLYKLSVQIKNNCHITVSHNESKPYLHSQVYCIY